MPTTSASSVNLYLYSSRIALGFKLVIGWLILWVVLISPLPLVFSLFLLCAIGRNYRYFFPADYSGVFRLRATGQVIIENEWGEKEEWQIRRVITIFNPLMVRIETGHHRVVRVWRDSCNEPDYRHLLVVLQYWERG